MIPHSLFIVSHFWNHLSSLPKIGCPYCKRGHWRKRRKEWYMNHWLWTEDSFLNFQNAIFFKILRIFFHRVTRIGLEPQQNSFTMFFSPNARGVWRFCLLQGSTGPLIDQLLRFFFANLVQTHDEQLLKNSSWYLYPFQIYSCLTEKCWWL